MPRQDVGRTRVNASLTNQTTNQVVYTVTAGRTLFLTEYALTAVNGSTTTLGQVNIRDDGTTKIPHLLQKDAVSAAASGPSLGIGLTLEEPIQFTTDVNIAVVGTVAYSIAIMGYEQ
jgi:hypothetical protein